MQPRELDRLIHEKAMGRCMHRNVSHATKTKYITTGGFHDGKYFEHHREQLVGYPQCQDCGADITDATTPSYSTDIAACGKMVDVVLAGDNADLFVMFLQDYWDGPVAMCEVDRMVLLAKLLRDPEKCCKAALRALGIPEGD